MDEDATLLSVLRVALGDNESLNSTLRFLTPENSRELLRQVTKQDKTGTMSFFTTS